MPTERQSLAFRALRSPTIRRLLILVLLIVVYQVWLTVQAGGKVDPAVGDERDMRGRFSADVELGFPPERYHILRMQKHGRIAGTDGNVVHLRGVAPAGVDALAREYWIERIVPPEDERPAAR
ncbi:hypothetical protein ACXZ65_04010 [Streptomyces aculeolatus]|jgi:hypothetical protein|uniref:hypothetical protein n=1 Tax=Streptomyces aculeolatus TaxID=270689 RepID=UPI0003635A3E|nr:hypothetical protein [Streptomyces aculeolatus]